MYDMNLGSVMKIWLEVIIHSSQWNFITKGLYFDDKTERKLQTLYFVDE